MYVSKSFCNIARFLINLPGQNAPLGELSAYGKSFSREVGVYADPTTPGYALLNFKSATDGQGGGPIAMPGMAVTASVKLIDFLVGRVTSQTGQIYLDQLLLDLTDYGSANGISQITIGEVTLQDETWICEWIKFKIDGLVDAQNQPLDNENTIWLVNEAFETEYSEYEIVVVPPIDNLDLFHGTGTSVVNMIKAITTPQIIDRIEQFKNKIPPTKVRSDEYSYVFKLDSSVTIKVNWPVIIYGPAGNNIDAIKDALVDYILSHSNYSRADWTVIFPDIFRRTEFIIAPVWHKYAIANRTQNAGVYSPIANLVEMDLFMKRVAPAYPVEHVAAHACVVPNPWRSINLMMIGGPENRESKFKISDVYADYIDVGNTDIDFNRQAPATQNWSNVLNQMLIISETMNQYTTLPQGFMKMQRDGILYLVKTVDNIQYLMACKRSVYALLNLTYE